MSYTIEINHEQKYIHYSHSGLIERVRLGAAWAELLTLKEFTDLNYNLLSDYRGAKFNFSPTETDVITEFLLSIKHILNGKKQSVMIDDPYSTAVSLMFENKLNIEIGFYVRVFSTESAALSWITD